MLKTYQIIFRTKDMSDREFPKSYLAKTKHAYQAEERFRQKYPKANILWISNTSSYVDALNELIVAKLG